MRSCLGLRKCWSEAQPLSHSSMRSTVLAFLRSWGVRAPHPRPRPHRECLPEPAPPTICTSIPDRSCSCQMLCSEDPGALACLRVFRFCSLAVLGLSPSSAAQSSRTLNNLLLSLSFSGLMWSKGVLPFGRVVEGFTCETVSVSSTQYIVVLKRIWLPWPVWLID